ncbi:hypothetical protein ACFLTK_03810 [Chloroflexota bacterium]
MGIGGCFISAVVLIIVAVRDPLRHINWVIFAAEDQIIALIPHELEEALRTALRGD